MSGYNSNDDVAKTGDEARVLRALIDEIREAQPPALDWDRVEASLLTRLEHERIATPTPKVANGNNSWAAWGGFAAAAAALVMLMAQGSQQPLVTPPEATAHTVNLAALTPLHAATGELPTYDAADIGVDARISSGAEPLRIEVKGVATWVLEPNSQARIIAASAPYIVALEHGALHAEVIPRSANDVVLETFAVEVGGTRVAVHGTVFTVTHRGDELSVEVSRGAVTVGPGGHRGITTGHLLVGPAHAAFSLDGAKRARMLPMDDGAPVRIAAVTLPTRDARPGSVATGHAAGDAAAAATAAAEDKSTAKAAGAAADGADRTGPANAKKVALKPTPEDAAIVDPTAADGNDVTAGERAADGVPDDGADGADTTKPRLTKLTAAQAQALVVGCLSQVMNSTVGKNTVLTISSRVSARTDADGNVLSVRFVPPLKPALQQRCAGTLFGRQLRGGPSVTFDVNLARR